VENLLKKAEAARVEREAAGISDSVQEQQPLDPPPFDSKLVGKKIEICWPYLENGARKKIWSSGIVKRVADGLSDKRSPLARKILPAGALLWAWEADPDFDEEAGEQWMMLVPANWNKHKVYGWRYDPSELAGAKAHQNTAWRRPQLDEFDTDEEYLISDDEN